MSQRILVVDDDRGALRLVGLVLEQGGYQVVPAQSGMEALDLLARDRPDLIILDVMMPQMDGIDFCLQVKADPHTADVPVIMLTAKADTASQAEGLRAGAYDYLTKPIHPHELLDHVQQALASVVSAPPLKSAQVISVLGARGGVGATTLAVNLALALSAQARTVLVDLEAGGAAAMHLGLTPSHGLHDLQGYPADDLDAARVEVALTAHPSGLRLLASTDEPVEGSQAEAILHQLRAACDVCLLDLGAGLAPVVCGIASHSNPFILALDSDRVTLAHARQVVSGLSEYELSQSALKLAWINRLGAPESTAGAAIRAALGRDPDAVIGPASEALYQALEQSQPLVVSQPGHPVAIQIRALAASLGTVRN